MRSWIKLIKIHVIFRNRMQGEVLLPLPVMKFAPEYTSPKREENYRDSHKLVPPTVPHLCKILIII